MRLREDNRVHTHRIEPQIVPIPPTQILQPLDQSAAHQNAMPFTLTRCLNRRHRLFIVAECWMS
jgi:hypothetical protein